jgi:hypothetical protein
LLGDTELSAGVEAETQKGGGREDLENRCDHGVVSL